MIIPFSAVVLKQKLCKVKHCQLSRWPHFKQNALVTACAIDSLIYITLEERMLCMIPVSTRACLKQQHGLGRNNAVIMVLMCVCVCAFVSHSFVDPV